MTQRQASGRLRRLGAGAVALVGYILSPLSPWNDGVVNVPIAVAAAKLLEPLGVPPAAGFYIGYAASNIAGLALLAIGAGEALGKTVTRRGLARATLASLAYSTLAYLLLHALGVV